MRIAIILVFITVLLLSACAPLPAQEQETPVVQNPEQPTPQPSETPLPPTDAGQKPSSPVDLPEGAVIEFQRSGGIAGLDEVWVIYADGRITLEAGDQAASPNGWQADTAQVTELLEVIDSLGFFTLEAGSGLGEACCDRFTYSLAVAYQGDQRQLSAVEGAAGMPDGFYQAVSEVEAFLLKASH